MVTNSPAQKEISVSSVSLHDLTGLVRKPVTRAAMLKYIQEYPRWNNGYHRDVFFARSCKIWNLRYTRQHEKDLFWWALAHEEGREAWRDFRFDDLASSDLDQYKVTISFLGRSGGNFAVVGTGWTIIADKSYWAQPDRTNDEIRQMTNILWSVDELWLTCRTDLLEWAFNAQQRLAEEKTLHDRVCEALDLGSAHIRQRVLEAAVMHLLELDNQGDTVTKELRDLLTKYVELE